MVYFANVTDDTTVTVVNQKCPHFGGSHFGYVSCDHCKSTVGYFVHTEEEEDEYNPFIPFFFVTCSVILIKNLPSYDMLPAVYRQKRILPPKRKGDPEFTLVVISLFSHVQVLDLDETLVHCSMEKTPGADLVFPVMLSSPADWARFTMRISAITCTPTFVPFSFIF